MPYSNIPEADQPKMERCVRHVMGQGHDKESAIAICYTSITGKADLAAQLVGQFDEQKTLVAFGGAIKALGDNRVGGLLIRFGNENEPDLSPARDWFHAGTYFGAQAGNGVDATINHGIPLKSVYANEAERRALEIAASMILPPIKTSMTDAGIFAECALDLSNEYQAMVKRLVEQGRMMWSSGAVEHLVKRTPIGNTNRVDRWIIGEAAFTPTPAEPRLGPIVSLKSLVELQQATTAEAGSTRAALTAALPMAGKSIPRPIPIRVK